MEWLMEPAEKIISSASIDIHGRDTRIEKVLPAGSAQENLRLSIWANGLLDSQPLDFSEEDLPILLYRAIHARILSQDFIGKLRQRIEI
jgi:hypothetical protein